jgi:hypothetical protein
MKQHNYLCGCPSLRGVCYLQVPKPLPINLTVQARPCTTGEELGIDGRCRACSANTYGRNGQCLKCKEGARCPGGALLLPEEGWWHSAPTSDVFIPCLQPEACRCALPVAITIHEVMSQGRHPSDHPTSQATASMSYLRACALHHTTCKTYGV